MLLRRGRLVERIGGPCRIALIVAPAGCGKSIALSQYLSGLASPWIRFDVRPDHASPLAFARGLAETARDISPGAGVSVAEAVANAASVEEPDSFLAGWMEANLESYRGTIVLDDVHHVAG